MSLETHRKLYWLKFLHNMPSNSILNNTNFLQSANARSTRPRNLSSITTIFHLQIQFLPKDSERVKCFATQKLSLRIRRLTVLCRAFWMLLIFVVLFMSHVFILLWSNVCACLLPFFVCGCELSRVLWYVSRGPTCLDCVMVYNM